MGTTIQISDNIWYALSRLKLRGDTFEDVIIRLIRKDNESILKEVLKNDTQNNKLVKKIQK